MSSPDEPQPLTADEVSRAALAGLGATVRRLIEAIVCCEAPPAVVQAARLLSADAAQQLAEFRRPDNQLSSMDRGLAGAHIHSAVSGHGNPIAPPLDISRAEVGVEAGVTFSRTYEGPPGYVHGGIIALVLNEVLGRAAIEADHYGMTAGLEVRYLRPLPLREPVLFRASVTGVAGRRTSDEGRRSR